MPFRIQNPLNIFLPLSCPSVPRKASELRGAALLRGRASLGFPLSVPQSVLYTRWGGENIE